ncbi:hypothetical protein ACTXI0_03835 [Arthrobacter rhombi]
MMAVIRDRAGDSGNGVAGYRGAMDDPRRLVLVAEADGQMIAARLTQKRLDWIWARSHEAWYVVNARNTASLELNRRWNFASVAEAARFHTTIFAGGRGMLFRAQQPIGFPNH